MDSENGQDEITTGGLEGAEPGNLRAAALAEVYDAEVAESAEATAQEEQVTPIPTERATPSSAGATCWAQPSKHVDGNMTWHGYAYVGAFANSSYCGLEHTTKKRRSTPPADDAVCAHCAKACGFIRRGKRGSLEVQRRARVRRLNRMGSAADRLDAAVDRLEDLLVQIFQGAGSRWLKDVPEFQGAGEQEVTEVEVQGGADD